MSRSHEDCWRMRCVVLVLVLGVLWPLCLLTRAEAEEAGQTTSTDTPTFTFRDVSETSLELWEGERPVLVYNYGTQSREGVPPRYNRSTYVHPLYGLDGEVLTDDFPDDHRHHRGIFWAWPHVGIGTEEFNLWAVGAIKQRFERWTERDVSDKTAVLGMENGWYVCEKRVVRETVRITVWPSGESSRSVDFDLEWTPVDQAVILQGAPGKSYGGFTVRFGPHQDAVITVPQGRTSEDLAVTRLPWADFTGGFDESPGRSGVAVFIDKAHPDYPPTWLTRHYGCLCVGWPGVEPQTFPPGQPVRCRYRVWIHRGEASVEQLERAYQQYNEAPRRTLLE